MNEKETENTANLSNSEGTSATQKPVEESKYNDSERNDNQKTSRDKSSDTKSKSSKSASENKSSDKSKSKSSHSQKGKSKSNSKFTKFASVNIEGNFPSQKVIYYDRHAHERVTTTFNVLKYRFEFRKSQVNILI